MSEYYDHTTVPSTGSSLSSATMRAEFDSIEAGFDKLPVLAGNALKNVRVNAGGTALEAVLDPARPASSISNTPAGNIAATDVQAAINELDSEKLAATATALNGTNIPASKTLVVTTDAGTVFEAANANIAKLNVAQTRTAVETMTPTSASSASYTWACNTDPNLVLTTTGALTMNAPTGLVTGAFYFLEIVYGGAHAVTWTTANFKGTTGISLTSTTAARDALMFRAQSGTILELVGLRKNVGAT